MSASNKKNAESVKNKRTLKIAPMVIAGLLTLNILQGAAFVIRANQEITMPPVYAADGYTGSVTKLVALPYNSQGAIAMANFASNAITFCLTMDFANYSDVLAECKSNMFSEAGYQTYLKALTDTGIYNLVQSGKGIIKAVIDGVPTLAEPGTLNTALVYTIEIPLIMEKKEVGKYTKPSRQVAIVMLARDNTQKNFDQLKVVRVIIEPRS